MERVSISTRAPVLRGSTRLEAGVLPDAKWPLIAAGAVGISGLAYLGIRYAGLATGVASMDRAGIRLRVLLGTLFTNIEPKWVMGVIANESRGDARNFLGDTTASGGPSVGPMQVYRATAKGLGLWHPAPGMTELQEREAYAQKAADVAWGIHAGIAVLQNKLKLAKGNLPLALRMYNGAGPAAEAYRDKLIAFVEQKWPGSVA